jgi:hypothetical protein
MLGAGFGSYCDYCVKGPLDWAALCFLRLGYPSGEPFNSPQVEPNPAAAPNLNRRDGQSKPKLTLAWMQVTW